MVKLLYYAVGQSMEVAEYTLLYLLSRVIKRKDIAVIGNFPLNIRVDVKKIDVMKKICEYIGNVIYAIAPHALGIKLQLGYLQKNRLASKKNQETSEMEPGVLQLCDQTYLLVNECTLEQGKLDELGVRNLKVIQCIIEGQQIYYDYEFQGVAVFTNYPILTLSGGKSIFRDLISVKIENPLTDETDVISLVLKDDGTMKKMRAYHAMLSSAFIEVTLPEEVTKAIQQDYVESRAKDQTIQPKDLELWVMLSRLYALSYGSQTVTIEHFQSCLLYTSPSPRDS